MPFSDATPYDPTKSGPSVKMRVRKPKSGGNLIVFTLNKAFIETHISDLQNGDLLKVQYGTGDAQGKIIIAKSPKGDVKANVGAKGAATITVHAWRGHMIEERKSTVCPIVMKNEGGAVIQDPFK